ncbi:MAG TPA: GatB/YqeY domain-containing protein [Aggregatilineaceae bacterium]|nr:GatB/YqeY domain-containing protein [Aggregatilineaceae bacterium]
MHPKEQIQLDLKEAMKSGDTKRREVLRLMMAAFKQVEVDKRIELSESDAIGILMTEAKKRRESIEEMERAGRTELAAGEHYELGIIETYLPKQLAREEIEVLARQAIQETGASSPKEMGNVMKVLMPRLKGQADGKTVTSIVQELLTH